MSESPSRPDTVPPAILLIISGPAGSGKTTLCDRLLDAFPHHLSRLVTTTSRPPRIGEINGIDYHFLSAAEFEQNIEAGEFIEWAKVHGCYYGSRKSDVLGLLKTGKDLLLNIDVQGARSFRNEEKGNPLLKDRVHSVFIQPESLEQLRERLLFRATDDTREIEKRLKNAREEIREAPLFDHIIVSGTREDDFQAILNLYLNIRIESANADPIN